MVPSFCVSAQWKIFWYSLGSARSLVEGMMGGRSQERSYCSSKGGLEKRIVRLWSHES